MASNPKWFQDRLRDKRLSQRSLAKLLNMDASSLSLLIHGKRRMRVEQAAEIARLLGVPVSDVMRQAGADIRETSGTPVAASSIPIVGWADDSGRAKLDWSTTANRYDLESGFPPTAVAIQWRTAQTRASIWDGWLMITLPPREPESGEMMDRYCVVGIKGTGETLIRTVRRGYTPGRFTLLDVLNDPIHDADVAWFAPILSIKPV